jgi:hypothetical protein
MEILVMLERMEEGKRKSSKKMNWKKKKKINVQCAVAVY